MSVKNLLLYSFAKFDETTGEVLIGFQVQAPPDDPDPAGFVYTEKVTVVLPGGVLSDIDAGSPEILQWPEPPSS